MDTQYTQQDQSRLFILSCIALTVTAMTFAIRAGILGDLGTQYGLSGTELGLISSMAFLGFPIATMVGGILYNMFGPRMLLWIAFIGHAVGLILTIYSSGFWGLIISTFLIGFANGMVEAACNPLIAETHENNKTTMLNKFHVWFPGGIVIGALVSTGMTELSYGWELQIAVMLIPTAIYGYMLLKSNFPKLNPLIMSSSENIKNLFSPLYIFLVVCMTLTATTELATGQWINEILAASGAHPMLTLALVTGIMAVGRYFAGPIVHSLNPVGVLVASAVLSTLGLYLMSQLQGTPVYFAAVVFALGVTYFWPTMLGCVGEYTPKTGAIGMSLIGGAGMFAVSIWTPIIGRWMDEAKAQALTQNLSENEMALASGQAVLSSLLVLPAILIVAFAALYFYLHKRGQNHTAVSEAG
ncbi:MFS transporter [Agaribacter flavus]|uniref:MFS transporter n=1 Tax=Agaribacter flavus TaxID=1902781 RepID=A0ABV7FNG9_9ALTE